MFLARIVNPAKCQTRTYVVILRMLQKAIKTALRRGEQKGGQEISPHVRSLEGSQKNSIEAEGIVRRLPFGVAYHAAHVGHLSTPHQTLPETNANRTRHKGEEVRPKVGSNPDEVGQETEDNGPLRRQTVDQHWSKK